VSLAAQVTCTKLLPALPGVTTVARPPPSGHVKGSKPVGPEVAVPQDDEVQVVPVIGLTAALAATTVQVATGELTNAVTGAGQVMVTQLLPALAVCGEHAPAGWLV